jgi:hypothetical protein
VPLISHIEDYNGFSAKVQRLGLGPLVAEIESVLTRFQIFIEERKHANGTRGIRQSIDDGFKLIDGWIKITSGGVDWTKTSALGPTVGVEIQVSGRSDMLAVDIMHLSERLKAGDIDIGIIVVPEDDLSRYLTDRMPNLATAVKHVEHRARDMPIRIIAFRHDGTGAALAKARTNLGRPLG